jgi:hypothetical protein
MRSLPYRKHRRYPQAQPSQKPAELLTGGQVNSPMTTPARVPAHFQFHGTEELKRWRYTVPYSLQSLIGAIPDVATPDLAIRSWCVENARGNWAHVTVKGGGQYLCLEDGEAAVRFNAHFGVNSYVQEMSPAPRM